MLSRSDRFRPFLFGAKIIAKESAPGRSRVDNKGRGVGLMKLCPLCRGEAKRRFGLGHTTAWACTSPDCGLFVADPQLDERSLTNAYTKHYYPSNGNGTAAVYENTPHEILRQTLDKAEAELGPLAGKSLLDLGCGVGGLCKVASEYGVRAVGIEPDANAREKACKSSGLTAFAGPRPRGGAVASRQV